ncbi:MAG: SRPBCC family protein [Pseudomonadota bacterium]|nr:SRPBCC family protein [Pseudomonadota bacterium]
MFVTAETEVITSVEPDVIWDYASDPFNWTASNPEEHLGLQFFNDSNRPEQGTTFHQKEYVAGIYADLHGRITYLDRPALTIWSGTATYKMLGGLLRFRIPEGGVLKMTKIPEGTLASHDVYIDFPNSMWGKLLKWYFLKILKGDKAMYNHTYKELVYFKSKLENGNA